jgi:hypothetical protein
MPVWVAVRAVARGLQGAALRQCSALVEGVD